MNHVDHLATVVECIALDVPVPLCPDCHAIMDTLVVTGPEIKMEMLDD